MSLFKILESWRGERFSFLEKPSSVVPMPKSLPKSDKIDFHKAESNYNLAKSFYEDGDYEACYQYIKDAILANYKYSQPYIILADLYLKAKKNYEAQFILKKAIEYTGNFNVYDKLAQIYAELGYKQKVLNLWYEYIKSTNKKAIGYMKIAEFCVENRDIKEALVAYEEALKHDKALIEIYEKIANIYEFLGEFEKAIHYLNLYLEAPEAEIYFRNASNKAKVYQNIGNLYFRLYKFEKAIEFYRKSLDLIFNNNEIYIKFGDICFITKDYNNAKKNYKIALQLKDDDIEILVKLATLNFVQNNFDEAKKYYSQIIKFNPTIDNIHALIKSIDNGNPDKTIMKEVLDENTDMTIEMLEDIKIESQDLKRAIITDNDIKRINEEEKGNNNTKNDINNKDFSEKESGEKNIEEKVKNKLANIKDDELSIDDTYIKPINSNTENKNITSEFKNILPLLSKNLNSLQTLIKTMETLEFKDIDTNKLYFKLIDWINKKDDFFDSTKNTKNNLILKLKNLKKENIKGVVNKELIEYISEISNLLNNEFNFIIDLMDILNNKKI